MMGEPIIAHECLHRFNGERGEKVNHNSESQQLSRKDQVFISRQRSGHHPELKYWLHKNGREPDTFCWKCSMGEETIEHKMWECRRINHPTSRLNEPYLATINALKALELRKAKHDLPGISQAGKLT